MASRENEDVTLLLLAAQNGEAGALDRLLPLLYDELHRLARDVMRGERAGTLQPTALVHEAWLKLVRQDSVGFRHRAGFFSAVATVMRRILVDHARARQRDKRGAGGRRLALDETVEALESNAGDLVELGAALDDLTLLDPRKAKLVELRFFVGLGMSEAAQVLELHQRQAEREWTAARAWLRRRLSAAD